MQFTELGLRQIPGMSMCNAMTPLNYATCAARRIAHDIAEDLRALGYDGRYVDREELRYIRAGIELMFDIDEALKEELNVDSTTWPTDIKFLVFYWQCYMLQFLDPAFWDEMDIVSDGETLHFVPCVTPGSFSLEDEVDAELSIIEAISYFVEEEQGETEHDFDLDLQPVLLYFIHKEGLGGGYDDAAYRQIMAQKLRETSYAG